MASRKPDLRMTIPERDQPNGRPQLLQRNPRSPRFREDFDAPFSESVLNASRTTLATDASDGYPSSHYRNSFDADSHQPISASAMHTKTSFPSPLSPRLPRTVWPSTESSQQSTVATRIRDWARRSFYLPRNDSEKLIDGYALRNQSRTSKSTVVLSQADIASYANPDRCHQPAGAGASMNGSR
ncbi:hypothetical protein DCS_06309 [Drechmeria coniospora]|uniref:Uncharacterized protein n=1 Tax=Drechmeria coniospora TaxID=98403 RepID=A0A151GB66_DRECN|nr:hypothetical protein DCS_06309 [Drechmeria coniospora]KYK54352.1 hypothetical protein DCS_06309 [Drechmeria coniospora]